MSETVARPRADMATGRAADPHPAIEVESLAKRYGEIQAVRGVSFT